MLNINGIFPHDIFFNYYIISEKCLWGFLMLDIHSVPIIKIIPCFLFPMGFKYMTLYSIF